MDTYQRILGSILGAAVGDAMGAATETKNTEMILQQYGGYVRELLPGQNDTFAAGCEKGFVTDDFSLAYFTAQELVKCRGDVTKEAAERALLRWADYPEYYRFAGPTTRASIDRIRGLDVPSAQMALACDNGKATDGSAMKIFPAGLIRPADPDRAVLDAVTLCLPTHDTDASLSGAGAIAAAVSAAAGGAGLEEVLEAGIRGARKGFEEGRKVGKQTAVASVEKRIVLAVEIGRKSGSWEERMRELSWIIGSGLAVNEAVPCVFGILAATSGEVMPAIEMGVNIGNDTDTVATMAGAIAGAMCGAEAIPEHFLTEIEGANPMDLRKLAEDIRKTFYQ